MHNKRLRQNQMKFTIVFYLKNKTLYSYTYVYLSGKD